MALGASDSETGAVPTTSGGHTPGSKVEDWRAVALGISHEAFMLVDSDGSVLDANAPAVELLGIANGDSFLNLVTPADRRSVMNLLRSLATTGTVCRDRMSFHCKTDEVVLFEVTFSATRSRRVVVAARRLEDDAEIDKLRALVDTSDEIAIILEPDGRWRYGSNGVARMVGTTSVLDTDGDILAMVHPDDRAESIEVLTDVITGGHGRTRTMTVRASYDAASGTWRSWSSVVRNLIEHPDVQGILINCRDVTEELQKTEELRTTTARLGALVEAFPDGVCFVDAEQQVLATNDAFWEILGVKRTIDASSGVPREELGTSLTDCFLDAKEAYRRILRIDNARQIRHGEEFALGDGRTIEISFIPIAVQGHQIGSAWILRDRTEHKRIETSLVAGRDEAVQALAEKAMFVAAVSHELRSPMHAVLGLTEILAQTDLDEDQQSLLASIANSASSLRSVIDDLLDFSKMEAGRFDLEEVPVLLCEVVNGAAEVVRGMALSRNIELQVDVPSEPVLVRGDPLRIRQVLVNLLSNAIKFTEKGHVAVRMEIADVQPPAEGSDGALAGEFGEVGVSFAVSDTGVGIESSNFELLFEPFHQADKSTSRRFGGTGLGLSICRRLAELMAGRLEVESQVGKGSTFTFSARFASCETPTGLPITPGATAEPLVALTPKPVTKSANILVVDDTDVNQLLARRQLENLGCNVMTASNGSEALELMKKQRFDLIFMDREMPILDGLATTRRIREREEAQGGVPVAVIALTAGAMDGDRETCLAAGMNGYLAKPVSIRAIADVLTQFLGMEFTASAGRPGDEAHEEVAAAVDRSVLDVLCEELGSVETVVELVRLYMEALPERAIALFMADRSRDTSSVATSAHALRSASVLVGAVGLARRCEEVEAAARDGEGWSLAGVEVLCAETGATLRAWLAEHGEWGDD